MTTFNYRYATKITKTLAECAELHRRGSQYIGNSFLGKRYEYLKWQNQFKNEIGTIPGIPQSDYYARLTTLKNIKDSENKLKKLNKELSDTTGFSEEQQKERSKIKKDIESTEKKLTSLHKKSLKQESVVYQQAEKCDIRSTIPTFKSEIEERDLNVTHWVKSSENHVDYHVLSKLLSSKNEDNIVSEPQYSESAHQWIDLGKMDSTTRQAANERLEKTYQRWVTPDKNGNRSGRPRFKSSKDYTSFSLKVVKRSAIKLEEVDPNPKNKFAKLCLPRAFGCESLRIVYHRPIPEGFTIKQVMFVKTGKKWSDWEVVLTISDGKKEKSEQDTKLADWDNSLGLDAVLHEEDYLALSNGSKIGSLKSLRKSLAKLADLQRKASVFLERIKSKTASQSDKIQYRKLNKQISRTHKLIRNQRKNFHYLVAHQLCQLGYTYIFHEKLNLRNLIRRNKAKRDGKGGYLPNGQASKSGLNLSWSDAAFGNFFRILKEVGSKYGVVVCEVNPQYTSKVLCYRDEFAFGTLNDRSFFDESEGITVDRDINAAVNVLRQGLKCFVTVGKKEVVKSSKNWSKQLQEKAKQIFQKRLTVR